MAQGCKAERCESILWPKTGQALMNRDPPQLIYAITKSDNCPGRGSRHRMGDIRHRASARRRDWGSPASCLYAYLYPGCLGHDVLSEDSKDPQNRQRSIDPDRPLHSGELLDEYMTPQERLRHFNMVLKRF